MFRLRRKYLRLLGNQATLEFSHHDVSHDSLHYVQFVSLVWLVFLSVQAGQEKFFSYTQDSINTEKEVEIEFTDKL